MSPRASHRHGSGLHYVYRIQSVSQPDHEWIDTTSNVKARVSLHNHGKVEETREYAPWVLTFYAAFPDIGHAKHFCRFLRSEPGHAFGRKHLWGRLENHTGL